QPHTSIHIYYYCKYISGDIKKSHESLELSYKAPVTITDWHKDHQLLAEEALRFFKMKKS
ncbi:MAG TPA: hypothetical protein VGN20_22845, partial [Mucilaginibacter sp.]